jgi:GH18 family chitinase
MFHVSTLVVGLALLGVARKQGMQLIVTLGSLYESHISGKEFSLLTNDEKSRAKFLNEILRVVNKFDLSGVSLKWLYPGCHQVICNLVC